MSIPSILEPVLPGAIKIASTSLAQTAEREWLHQLIELLQPLALITTRRKLDLELGKRSQKYWHLVKQLQNLINATAASEEKFMPLASKGFNESSDLLKRDEVVLDSRERQNLLLLLDNLKEVVEASINTWQKDPGSLIDVLMCCSPWLPRVNMCLLTILLVLTEEIREWDKTALKLLSRTAKTYMDLVEDAFLAHNNELRRRLDTSSPTVSIEKVKQELGLPGSF